MTQENGNLDNRELLLSYLFTELAATRQESTYIPIADIAEAVKEVFDPVDVELLANILAPKSEQRHYEA